MNREELDDLMLLYVSGAADDSERAAAEAKLASGDRQAKAAHDQAMEIISTMPLALDSDQPPVQLRDRLLFRVTSNIQRERQEVASVFPWSTKLAAGIAALLAIALTVTLFDRQNLLNRVDQLSRTNQNFSEVMQSPYVSLAKLDSQSKMPCSGRVLYCPVNKEYQVMVFDLVPPPPGKEYELWLITPANEKVAAGMIKFDPKGVGMVNFKAPKQGSFAFAAITDEPSGGSAQPSGTIQLLGNLRVQ